MRIAETLNDGLKREYSVTIPAKTLADKVDAQLATVASQIRMPGFRPGKVPANLVRKMHGEQLSRDALNEAVQEAVNKVVAEHSLRPAMQPSVSLDDYQEGRDVALAQAIEEEDDSMDALQRQLFTLVLSPNWSRGTEAAIDMTQVGRHYERFADHAVGVARRTIFIVTGRRPSLPAR